MIDYLEELLEEEAAVDLAGRPLVTMGRKKRVWQEDEENPEEDRRGGLERAETEGEGREAGVEGKYTDKAKGGSWAESAARESRTLVWLEANRGGVPGGASLAEWLRRAERTARAAAGGQGVVSVTLPGEGRGHRPVDLLTLDRAVQRDARRYDGGFSLY